MANTMNKYQKGFTLIDALITVVILGILAGIAFPTYQNYMQNVRLERARNNIANIAHFLEEFYAKNHTFCTTGVCQDINKYDGLNNVIQTDSKHDVYTFGIWANDSTFTIYAQPEVGFYSDSTLANKKLKIMYFSTSATASKCDTAGFQPLGATNKVSDPGEHCEVM